MKIFFVIAFSLLAGSFSTASTFSQPDIERQKLDDVADKSEIDTAIKKLMGSFSSITSFSYESSRVSQLNPKHFKPEEVKRERKGTIAYTVQGCSFKIDDKVSPMPDGYKNHSLMTFDGECYQWLQYQRGRLYIDSGTKVAPNQYILRWSNDLLQPFEYFPEELLKDDFKVVCFEELKDAKQWESFKARLVPAGHYEVGGKPCLAIKLPSGPEGRTQAPSSYVIYLSKNDEYFPIAWDRLMDNGKPIYQFDVLELGTKEALRYPIKARRIYFGGGKAQHREDGTYSTVSNLKVKSVNQTFNIETFSIDPALATYIWDNSTKVMIEVPK